MSDEEDEREEGAEDHAGFADWLVRPIGDGDLAGLPRFVGPTVPDREPTGESPWLPRGPGSVGGRVRALALDPELLAGRARAVFAGAASGGVFRTRDQGRSWSSIWPHSMPSPAIGALAAGLVPGTGPDAGTRYLWAATGEPGRISGAGVYRAVLAPGIDDPVHWELAGSPERMHPGVNIPRNDLPVTIEVAAIDPANPRVCWFVGDKGVYRCRENPAGTFTWSRFVIPSPAGSGRSGLACADVKFVETAHGRYVVLAPQDTAWGDLILLPDPDDTDANIQSAITAAVLAGPAAGAVTIGTNLAAPVLAAGATRPLADPPRRCANVRIAIVAGAGAPLAPDRVYAIYTTQRATGGERTPFHLLCRADCIAATGTPARPAWTTTSNWTRLHDGSATPATIPNLARQNQGEYNLFLLASAGGAGGDQVIWGMIDAFISVDSGATFTQMLDWLRYDQGDRGQHADQHAAVLEPATAPATPTLWIGNDGGVARTSGFLDAAGQPRPAETSGWRRSISGLVIGQTYDLSQSGVLPDVCAIALQDVGGWVDGGGGSWRHVQGGDGLGIAFDPHDPHHLIAVWQGSDDLPLRGCNDIRFEGSMALPPDEVFRAGGWHRALFRGVMPRRPLARGLVPADRGTFEDTVLHPTQPGRIVHIRKRRLYTTSDGERWTLQPVGDRFELFVQLTVPALTAPAVPPVPLPQIVAGVMVRLGGSAAIGLGFHRGEYSDLRATTGQPGDEQLYRVRAVSMIGEPALTAGDQLDLTIEVATGSLTPPARFRRNLTVRFANATYTYAEALAALQATLTGALGGNWLPLSGAGAQALPGGAIVEAYALPVFAGIPASIEIVSERAGSDVDITVGPAAGANRAAGKLLAEARAYRGDRERPAVVTLQATNHKPTTDPAPAAVNGADLLELAAHVAAPGGASATALGGTLSYTFPPNPATGTMNPFYSGARPLAHALVGALGAIAPRPQLRVWPLEGAKWVRLRAGRLDAAAFTPFQLAPASTALAGLTAGNPPAPAGDQVLVDLKPRLRGRYDLRPATGAGGTRLTINIGGTPRHIDFAPADFHGSLAGVTVEEVRRAINEALNHSASPPTDIIVEVQRELEVMHPTEVAYSPSNPDVIWVGGLNHLWVTTNGGTSWRDLFPQPNAEQFRNWNNFIYVEAIAPDPFPPADPTNPVYTALVGIRGGGWVPLFRMSTAADAVELPRLDRPSGYEPSEQGPLRIYALEGDPRRRNTYYAATEIGVYRSTDGGDSWAAYSVGLPHLPTLDLALDRATDTLRVAAFGRGVYERALGDGAPPPRTVWLRANSRDAGRRPVVHGPEIAGDTPVWVDAVHSPDILLSSMPEAAVRRLDAVELDDLPSEPARPATPFQVAIRVHNRGAFAIGDARVIALWADASTELPELEEPFWTALGTGPIAAGTVHVGWTVIGDERGISIDAGGAQRVVFGHAWAPTPPATANPLDVVSQVALLAIVTRDNTTIDPPRNDVGTLVLHDARVAVRLADVRGTDGGSIQISAIVPDTTAPIGGNLPGLAWIQLAAGPAPVPPGPALDFAAAAGALPAPVVASTTAGPWIAEQRTLVVRTRERFPVPLLTHSEGTPAPAIPAPALDAEVRTVEVALDHAGFVTPASVTAPEMRAYLQRRLSRETRLFRVDGADVELALRRSAGEIGARVGGLAWSAGEVVVTAPGTAATDADFSLLALARPADVAIGSAQRFSIRVWNQGDIAVLFEQARLFWLDPHAAGAPTPAPLGTPQAVVAAAGRSAIVSVEDTIAAISGSDVLVLADVLPLGSPAPVPAFADWDAVITWASRTRNTLVRMFRRR